MTTSRIFVCGWNVAEGRIAARSHDIGGVISIADDNTPRWGCRPKNLDLVERRLHLEFEDTESECSRYKAPTSIDIRKIVSFARQYDDQRELLIHCYAGISRSTAAAQIVLWEHQRTTGEVVELQPLCEEGGDIMPNSLMLGLYLQDFGRP